MYGTGNLFEEPNPTEKDRDATQTRGVISKGERWFVLNFTGHRMILAKKHLAPQSKCCERRVASEFVLKTPRCDRCREIQIQREGDVDRGTGFDIYYYICSRL